MKAQLETLLQQFLRDERVVTVEDRSPSDRANRQTIFELYGDLNVPEPECYRHLFCDPAYNEMLMALGVDLIGAEDVGASPELSERLYEFCDYCGGGMRRENLRPQDARLTPEATDQELTKIGYELICELAATCNRSVETITYYPTDKTPSMIFRIKRLNDPVGLPGYCCRSPLCEWARFLASRDLFALVERE